MDLGLARFEPDPDRPRAWTLLVDGTPQSHVDLDDPFHLEFEYVRWLARATDVLAPPGPLNALHLGGGAWTLARYLAAARPGSRQRVVEVDAALVTAVRAHLPDRGSGIRVRTGDAREVLAALTADSAGLVVLDAFAGARIPAHLTTRPFVADAARVLRADGTFAANVPDGGRLEFARSQVATVGAVFPQVTVLASPQVLRGRRFGNLVVLGGHRPPPLDGLARLVTAEPFRARVLDDAESRAFAGSAVPAEDGAAVPSPAPPPELFRGAGR